MSHRPTCRWIHAACFHAETCFSIDLLLENVAYFMETRDIYIPLFIFARKSLKFEIEKLSTQK